MTGFLEKNKKSKFIHRNSKDVAIFQFEKNEALQTN